MLALLMPDSFGLAVRFAVRLMSLKSSPVGIEPSGWVIFAVSDGANASASQPAIGSDWEADVELEE
ncbi:MAG: hypothetical protein WAP37_01085 [Solirubrobacterales bacterium]